MIVSATPTGAGVRPNPAMRPVQDLRPDSFVEGTPLAAAGGRPWGTRPPVGALRQGRDNGTRTAGSIIGGPLGFTAAVWGTSLLDMATGHSLAPILGITPRTAHGLVGVVGAPFVHVNPDHLLNNTVGLLLAGSMVAASGPTKFRDVTLISMLASGVGMWATGSGLTVGASGVAYGYIGYNMARGLFDRSPEQLALTGLSTLLFLGSLSGLLPGAPGVAWQGHLIGFAAGVAAAAVLPKDG
ncbi:MAG: rhomboid family intramembrane serine protease [Candidatus Eremiobacterota bacterium]